MSVATDVEVCNKALAKLGVYVITSLDDDLSEAEKCKLLYAGVRDRLLQRHKWNFARRSVKLLPVWITGFTITSASPLVNIHQVAHGLTTGTLINLENTSVNGQWSITVVDADNFTLNGSVYQDATVGRYTVAPPFGWAFQMTLPTDCLHVRTINGWENARMATADFAIEGRQVLMDCEEAKLVYTRQVTDPTLFDDSFIDCLVMQMAIELSVTLVGGTAGASVKSSLIKEYEAITFPQARYSDAIENSLRVINQAVDSPAVRARLGYDDFADYPQYSIP